MKISKTDLICIDNGFGGSVKIINKLKELKAKTGKPISQIIEGNSANISSS